MDVLSWVENPVILNLLVIVNITLMNIHVIQTLNSVIFLQRVLSFLFHQAINLGGIKVSFLYIGQHFKCQLSFFIFTWAALPFPCASMAQG